MSEWISIKDRLPEDYNLSKKYVVFERDYLVDKFPHISKVSLSRNSYVTIASYDRNNMIWTNIDGEDINALIIDDDNMKSSVRVITHWIELPEPPR